MILHVAAAGGTLARTGPGFVRSVSINTGVAGGALTLRDGTTAAGTAVAAVDATSAHFVGPINWPFGAGLYVVAAGALDATIEYVANDKV
jgi:hypothetical protein